ncbi:MAG: hypothetical protein Q4F02_03380 [Candidatus Saccharibacteria bacterium]|nr:hypothetical protein [Candidatus Saccharibacteria bacterium]
MNLTGDQVLGPPERQIACAKGEGTALIPNDALAGKAHSHILRMRHEIAGVAPAGRLLRQTPG